VNKASAERLSRDRPTLVGALGAMCVRAGTLWIVLIVALRQKKCMVDLADVVRV